MQCNAQSDRPTYKTMPRVRLHLLPPRLLYAAALSAYSHERELTQEAQHAQPPIPAARGTHPAPLGEADITLYLQVMREAALRVQHPTAAERQMLARADAITEAANRGDASGMATDNEVLAQALAFHMQMDL